MWARRGLLSKRFPFQTSCPLSSSSLSYPLYSSYRWSSTSPPNYYELLQLDRDASPKQIKSAYYSLSKTCHPDLHPNDEKSLSTFLALNEAYSTLSNPESRKKYDFQLASHPRAKTGSHGHFYRYTSSQDAYKKTGPGFYDPSVKFDFEAHRRGHYGSFNSEMRDRKRMSREARNRYYQELYETDPIHKRIFFSLIFSVGTIVFIFYSGYVQMIFI